jgi:hypothetical protein
MRTIKKDELLKILDVSHLETNQGEEQLDELVDGDGGHIEGGTKDSTGDIEVKTAPGQTTDDYAQSAIQPNNYFYGIYGTPYSSGSRYVTNESKEKVLNKIKKIISENNK